MDSILSYLLKCIISSGILTAYYWIVLRNKKFHYYNRFYLLSAMLVSLVIPFLNFRLFRLDQPTHPYISHLLHTIGSAASASGTTAARFDWEWLLAGACILVSIGLSGVLIFRIARICTELRTRTRTRMKGFYLIETQMPNAPFSFLNYLFWRNDIPLASDDGEKILRHELTHIEQKHTYDKLFSQAVVCFFWMNPFYWIIQKELNMIHEFIADEASVKEGDAASFARILLQSYNEGAYLNPSHSFFHSPIKRRLIMITQSNKTSYSYLRRILALPIILSVVSLFSCTVLRAQSDKDTSGDAKRYAEKLDAEKIAQDQRDRENGRLLNGKLKLALMQLSQGPAGDKMDAKKLMEAILKDPPDITYYVNGGIRSPEYIKSLKEEDVTAVNVYTGDAATKKFGDNARHGIVEFSTKK